MATEALSLMIQERVSLCKGKRSKEININSSFRKLEGRGEPEGTIVSTEKGPKRGVLVCVFLNQRFYNSYHFKVYYLARLGTT